MLIFFPLNILCIHFQGIFSELYSLALAGGFTRGRLSNFYFKMAKVQRPLTSLVSSVKMLLWMHI